MLCLYGLLYHERGIRGARTNDLYDTEKGAMKAEGQARPELPRNPGYKSVGYCMRGTGRRAQRARG